MFLWVPPPTRRCGYALVWLYGRQLNHIPAVLQLYITVTFAWRSTANCIGRMGWSEPKVNGQDVPSLDPLSRSVLSAKC